MLKLVFRIRDMLARQTTNWPPTKSSVPVPASDARSDACWEEVIAGLQGTSSLAKRLTPNVLWNWNHVSPHFENSQCSIYLWAELEEMPKLVPNSISRWQITVLISISIHVSLDLIMSYSEKRIVLLECEYMKVIAALWRLVTFEDGCKFEQGTTIGSGSLYIEHV